MSDLTKAEMIKKHYKGNSKILTKIQDAIKDKLTVMMFLKKATGVEITVTMQPKDIKVQSDKSGVVRPLVTGTSIGLNTKFVQYYIDQIFKVQVLDNLGKSQPGFKAPKIFENSKFNSWGHFKENK